MPIAPKGRFILVNMDRCQDLMGGCSSTLHRAASGQQSLKIGAAFVQQGQICEHYYTYTERSLSLKIDGKFKI